MLHNEARELLVSGYEKLHDAQAIAEAYCVSVRTYIGWWNKNQKQGAWRCVPASAAESQC